jgi:hypothetical protein
MTFTPSVAAMLATARPMPLVPPRINSVCPGCHFSARRAAAARVNAFGMAATVVNGRVER